MNEITPYEQLIAEKLDQVPVPDMADSIWSSIEMQLDAPTNVPEAPAQKPASILKSIGWYGLAGIVAVVALLWWYFSHKGHEPKDTMPPKALPEKHAPLPVAPPPVEPSPVAPSPAGPAPVKKNAIPVVPGVIKKDTASSHDVPKDSVRIDSGIRRILPPVNLDSSHLQKVPLPDVDLYGTPPPLPTRGKKHKGVKGITDDDYKISAGKDSGRKKN